MISTGRPGESRRRRRLVRLLRRGSFALGAVVVLYVMLLLRPEILFAHRLDESAVLLYSRRPVSREAVTPHIRKASGILERSEIFVPDVRHRVFVTGSSALYRLLNGPYYGAIGRNVDVGHAIFLPELDETAGRVLHFDGRSARLVEILAHEACHTFVSKRLGIRKAVALPFWKKEGYPQYVSLDFIDPSEAAAVLAAQRGTVVRLSRGSAIPRSYLEAAAVWGYLLEVRGESFDEVVARTDAFPALLGETMLWGSAAGAQRRQ